MKARVGVNGGGMADVRAVLAVLVLLLPAILMLSACKQQQPEQAVTEIAAAAVLLPAVPDSERTPVNNDRQSNPEAPVPPMCYTKTEGRHNPCYVCHQLYPRQAETPRMNQLDDGGIQGTYLFSDEGTTNHWANLFVDRTDWLQQVSDENILTYINQDNYRDLAPRLQQSGWQGFVPDLQGYGEAGKAFDDAGFARDGSGWVAFNYKPLPSTFWPTNGSTDDVLIRLPKAFRETQASASRIIYQLNLALLELNIKQLKAIDIAATDEQRLAADLDGDGVLRQAVQRLVAQPHYFGDAAAVAVVPQQYPTGTEFLHSVRYVGIDEQGRIQVPARMKELRYMRKIRELSASDLDNRYRRERKEKVLEELPYYVDLADRGRENGMGWLLTGFIEDYDGKLRPQSHEETFFCMGCHAAIGTTIDQTFAFARKPTGPTGWGYINLHGMADAPSLGQSEGEILQYLKRAGGGNEFRENPEMLARWFLADGSINEAAVKAADVYTLLAPSRERALALNKAYSHIVRHQSFIHGRDASWLPAQNVYREIDESVPPLRSEHRMFGWDLRLDWSAATHRNQTASGNAGALSSARR